MEFQQIIDHLRQHCDRWIVGSDVQAIDPWIEVTPESLDEVAHFLRDDPSLLLNMLHCITGIDYLEASTGEKNAAEGELPPPRVEMLYHFSSMVHGHRLVLKVTLPRWQDGLEGQLPGITTVSHIWSTAAWHEREVYDLMGVRFLGHRDLRRILCPEDWQGHPLRKDYKTPETYHGIPTR